MTETKGDWEKEIAHRICYWCGTTMFPVVEGRQAGQPNPIIGLCCPKCGSETRFPKPLKGYWP